ncbi:MAG TPA: MlaD family protein [Thermoleophilaceae bacterium]|nr:MlaD family protein [Thermoleophilaceae bacterium]
MRRLVTAFALAALVVVALIAVGAGGSDDGYRVRAIFDNVSAAVPGEDVKVAGARVGTIESLDVTAENKAAVVLAIDVDGFTPFHQDARCTIRPQSLIGEKYVECDPGDASSPPLEQIEQGDGEGQHLLPLARTSSPVDLDLINDIMRLPFRERLTILLDELGAGLAGRGEDLNELIRRANPALRETDRVLAILARQNRVLANLARDSDTALAPLAREKERVAGFIRNANATGQATAERSDDIELGIQRLPGFLRELRPLMADLEGFADQGAPVARDLRLAGPALSRLIEQIGPFSSAATPSLVSLGKATVTGRPALIETRPLIQDLGDFARQAKPLSTNLDKLTASFDKTGGIERLADYLFFQTLAINGFDGIGHYLRAGLSVNLCALYATQPASGCNSNFTQTRATSAGADDLAPALANLSKLGTMRGGRSGSSAGSVPAGGDPAARRLADQVAVEGERNVDRIREGAAGPSPALDGVADPLLDYLFGASR